MCVGCALDVRWMCVGCALDLRMMRVLEIARELRVRHAQDFFADFTQLPPLSPGYVHWPLTKKTQAPRDVAEITPALANTCKL